MAVTIDMQMMRYINLFSRISRVSTTNCFVYNNQIIFAVPKSKVSIAIGKGAENIKKIRGVLGKKVRVISIPSEDPREGITKFIEEIVDPVEFSKVDLKGGMVTITAGRQSKAALIGRNRVREKELTDILKNFYRIEKLKIA